MRIIATDPDTYIEALPLERRQPVALLRDAVRSGLPEGFAETMQYDMITYVVPHERYPAGYHVKPADPLPFVSVAAQKNHIALYHMGLYAIDGLLDWFTAAYAALGIGSLDVGKSCIRFHHPAKIPYELIKELCGRVSVDRYMAAVEHAMAARQVKTKTKAGKPRSGDTASTIQQ